MKDSVSSPRPRVFAVAVDLPVVWVSFFAFWTACSILTPYGFPWTGIGWGLLALSAVLWTGKPRRLAAVPAVAARSRRLPGPMIGALLAALSLAPTLLWAGAPDAANLSACKYGWSSCDRARLTLVERSDVARAERARNLWNCKSGWSSCDPTVLTEPEALQVAQAKRQRNVWRCQNGWNGCDHAKLDPRETAQVDAAARARIAAAASTPPEGR